MQLPDEIQCSSKVCLVSKHSSIALKVSQTNRTKSLQGSRIVHLHTTGNVLTKLKVLLINFATLRILRLRCCPGLLAFSWLSVASIVNLSLSQIKKFLYQTNLDAVNLLLFCQKYSLAVVKLPVHKFNASLGCFVSKTTSNHHAFLTLQEILL